MVALLEVIKSNERIAKTFPDGLVAVFIGATNGVGEYTVKAFARYTASPRVYIVGRAQEAADRIIAECQQLNSGGKFEFIQADISLLKNIDAVCRKIKNKETAINILFQSQGNMAFNKTTAEGLNLASSIIMHGRTRFILNLLPLLRNATSLRRVIRVGAASYEGVIDTENLSAIGLSVLAWRDHTASCQTLLMEEAARRAPEVSFIHCCPGVVKSGITRELEPNLKIRLMYVVAGLLGPLIYTSPSECAERHVFLATSARYAPGKAVVDVAGVQLTGNETTARLSNERTDSKVYSIDAKGECSPAKVEKLLRGYRQDGTAAKVWEYVRQDFLRITGSEVVL